MPISEPVDEDELEADLQALEQENLNERMLTTGNVPVSDSVTKLPAAANGESKFSFQSALSGGERLHFLVLI